MPIRKLAIFVVAVFLAAQAQASQSVNYKLLPNIVDSGGEKAVSTNYIVSSKAGIISQSKISGSSFSFYPGFFFPITVQGPPNDLAFVHMEDQTPPTIEVQVSGNDNLLWSNDPIPAAPTFKITITDNVELDPNSVVVKIDGSVKINSANLVDSLDPAKPQGDRSAIYLTCSTSLSPGTHSLYIEAKDKSKNPTFKQFSGLEVAAPGSDPVVKAGSLVVSPTAFSPGSSSGGTMTIAFSVNNETEVTMLIYGPGGRGIEWTRKIRSQAGYNQVEFNGVSDLSHEPMANGIYVLKVIANGKELGKQYLVVYGGKK